MSVSVSVQLTGADLPGHLLVDRLADLAGHRGALLHGGLHGHGVGDSPAVLSGHGHTGGLWDLPHHGVTLGHRLGSTDGVGHVPLDGLAGLPGHRGTLGHCHTLGHRHTVGSDDLCSRSHGHVCQMSLNSTLPLSTGTQTGTSTQ